MSGGDPEVYDKASWHSGGNWPAGLPEAQAYVHAGLFLAWIVDRGLASAAFAEGFPELVDAFRARKKTGPEVYALAGGVLASDMLNADGNAFAREYFDLERGAFLADYEGLLGAGLPSMYHVADTWPNYDKLRAQLDARFARWLKSRPAR